MILVPVNLCGKINPAVIGIHEEILCDFGRTVAVNKTQCHTQRPVLQAADITGGDILRFLPIENINVPGVIIHGLIFINTQHISFAF